MVLGTGVLLRRWLLLWALFGTACDAEMLGVRVSKGGAATIDSKTIKRDLWKMTDPRIGGRAPGSSGARRVSQYIADRFESTGLEPAFDGKFRFDMGKLTGEMVCGVRKGAWDQAILLAALDPGIGTLSAVPVAGLLNLASAFHTREAPMYSMVFCVLPEAGGFTGFPSRSPIEVGQLLDAFLMGTLTGASLDSTPGPLIGPIQSQLLHSGPLSPVLSDDIGQLEYDTIRARVADIYLRVSSVD
jgi:hypothetical protein